MSEDAERRKRALARAGYPGRKGGLELLAEVAETGSTPSERIAQVRVATLLGWRISGKPLPSYLRSETPGRIIRGRSST